ncbi:hypothetical protein CTM53_06350 [Prevotella intermedia]|uniref:Uncharacterized protein n=1 Tax=Prevotella intermedia TaxID=28131 RepID=A0AAJ3VF96_PREIN|nr:hypothetical protein [Prevotella intermedia]ATV54539.1 hypothetical protein CTM61_03350 [Prevotella intermedia]PJI20473.1 hypothetical protein CTM53_06350 [Prevotella intermedia]
MDNSYYILSKEEVSIERLHICTWEFPQETSFIEFGLEFSHESFISDSIKFYLAAPFVKKENITVTPLLKNLSDRDNARFIFNDVVKIIKNAGNESMDWSILSFEKRDSLTVLLCDIDIDNGFISFDIKNPNKYEGNLYFRVLIEIKEASIAIRKKGIAQTIYIYDFKINETRNLPQDIYELKTTKKLVICKVKKIFCLHAVPDNFVFSFVDSSKLKNIRKLETTAFQKYLPAVKSISKDSYNIMFLKDDDCDGKESYSLFSICTEETIGSKQIALAIGANILCSLLFALSSFRYIKDSKIEWYRQIPWEYWLALLILVLLLIYLFTPLKKKF